jgi:hypothetical protein
MGVAGKDMRNGLHTTMTVPEKPPPSGTLFLWPGLQPLPGGKNYNPIGNGVLQPVLMWSGTCAPTAPSSYASWWISAQYVNTYCPIRGATPDQSILDCRMCQPGSLQMPQLLGAPPSKSLQATWSSARKQRNQAA